MFTATKIATCCYCGTRAALVLTADRHELSCSACGAPLHNLKKLPAQQVSGDRPRGKVAVGKPPSEKRSHSHKTKQPRHEKKRKSRKGFAQRFFEEAFDVIEDIFD